MLYSTARYLFNYFAARSWSFHSPHTPKFHSQHLRRHTLSKHCMTEGLATAPRDGIWRRTICNCSRFLKYQNHTLSAICRAIAVSFNCLGLIERKDCPPTPSTRISGCERTCCLLPMPSETTLHLLIFEIRYFPKSMSHWALFLPFEENGHKGRIASVRKHISLKRETLFEFTDFDTRTQQQMTKIPLPLIIEETKLLDACHQVTKNRSFDFWVKNCQKWVCEVVERIEDDMRLETHISIPQIAQSHGYRIFHAK